MYSALAKSARISRGACGLVVPSRRLHGSSAPRSGEILDSDFTALGGRSSVSGVQATVFGATGFMARYIINRLGRTGSRVIVPYRGDGHEVRSLKLMGDLGQIVPLPFSIKNPESVKKCLDGSNVVINLIGNDFETMNYKFEDTYLGSAETIVDAAKSQSVKRYINVSSVNAKHSSQSRRMRVMAERDAFVASAFPDHTTIKVSDVFGMQDRFTNWIAKQRNLFPFVPLVNEGKQKIQPVAVQNVADAVVNSIFTSAAKGNTYQLAGPQVMELQSLITDFCKTMYRPDSNAVDLTIEVARLYGRIGEMLRPVKPNWAVVSSDRMDQMLEDNTLPDSATLGFEDLGVKQKELIKIHDCLAELSMMHQGERGPTIETPGRRAWD